MASVETVGGDTVTSEPETIRQDEIDTAREEYVELKRSRVPARTAWGNPSSVHFSAEEMNGGDYSVFVGRPALFDGLERLRERVSDKRDRETPLTVTSGFRNPVHHSFHVRASFDESEHQYGLAADLRIRNQPVPREIYFELLMEAAKSDFVAACFEPKNLIRAASETGTLTHAHVQWTQRCPEGWGKRP